MPDIIDRMNYKDRIKEMGSDERSIFTATTVYDVSLIVENHGKRIKSLENRGNKVAGAIGGLGVAIGSGLIMLWNYLRGQ